MSDNPQSRTITLYRMVGENRHRIEFTIDTRATIISEKDLGPVESPVKPSGVSDNPDVYRFFSPSSPCWFEGCEELRERFDAEVQEAQSRAGEACSGCLRGPIIRKYVPLVEEALHALHAKN